MNPALGTAAMGNDSSNTAADKFRSARSPTEPDPRPMFDCFREQLTSLVEIVAGVRCRGGDPVESKTCENYGCPIIFCPSKS
jgi:hypothetical protein